MLQTEALSILKTGSNIFLTGVPGAGKTYVVNEYVKYLEDKGIYPAITASTGIAATHIGGTTVHSFSGIGIESNIDEYRLEKILEREKLVKKIQNTKVLIIDEISMLDAQTLDNVNKVLKAIKNPELPFGGVQVIFVGDFFQLPPVSKKGEMKNYCFASNAWREAKPLTCYLEEQYRQSDEVFTKLLLAIRANEIEEDHIEILDNLVKKTNKKFGIKSSFKEQTGKEDVWEEETVELDESPTTKVKVVEEKRVFIDILELHSHNKDVDQINDENLKNLEGKEFVYKMLTTGKSTLVESLIKTCLSPETLRLKVGAKVIFTKNSPDGEYANGTLAEVVELESWYIKVRTKSGRMIDVKQVDWSMEDNGKVLAKLSQYPLRLAWAITVHKSQGMSLDEAIINLGVAFEYGQGYVALSRIRNLKGVYLKSYNAKSLRVNESISEFDQKIRKDSRFIQNKFLKADKDKLTETHNRFIIKAGGRLEGGIKRGEAKKETAQITLDMLSSGKTMEEVAVERDLSVKTLMGHIEEMYKKKKISKLEVSKVASVNIFNIPNVVKKSFKKNMLKRDEEGNIKLAPVFKDLKEKYSYEDLRWYRMFL
jgi:ATP-dependent DNA helicase PIF1